MNGPNERQSLPNWLAVWWWVAFVVAAPLYLRLLWEQTFLTWRAGRQMIGFSLVHRHLEILVAGLAGYVLFLAWIIVTAVYLAMKRTRPSRSTLAYLSIPCLATALNFVPYDFWAKLGGVL
jgi:hypothetical protein